jgi:hypothetical protein
MWSFSEIRILLRCLNQTIILQSNAVLVMTCTCTYLAAIYQYIVDQRSTHISACPGCQFRENGQDGSTSPKRARARSETIIPTTSRCEQCEFPSLDVFEP